MCTLSEGGGGSHKVYGLYTRENVDKDGHLITCKLGHIFSDKIIDHLLSHKFKHIVILNYNPPRSCLKFNLQAKTRFTTL